MVMVGVVLLIFTKDKEPILSKAKLIKTSFMTAANSAGFRSDGEVARRILGDIVWVMELTKVPTYAKEYQVHCGVFVKGIAGNVEFFKKYGIDPERPYHNHCHIRFEAFSKVEARKITASKAFVPNSDLPDEKRISSIQTAIEDLVAPKFLAFDSMRACCNYVPPKGEMPVLLILRDHCKRVCSQSARSKTK